MSACAAAAESEAYRLVGDPIDVVTGQVTDHGRDFRLIGPLPFEWERYYNSRYSHVACSLGHGHGHACDWRLLFDVDGISLVSPIGRRSGFATLRDGDSDQQGNLTLQRVNSKLYQLRRPGQPCFEFSIDSFDRVARPTRVFCEDANIVLRYSDDGFLAEITHSTGLLIEVIRGGDGRSLRFDAEWGSDGKRPLLLCEFDETGNLTSETDALGRRLGFAWDSANRLIRKTDRRGYCFSFEYDDKGRCVRSAGEDGMLGVTLEYHPEMGFTRVTHADGGVWEHFYDINGRQTRVVRPKGTIEFLRDEAGRLIGEKDPVGTTLVHVHDAAGGLVAKKFATGRRIAVVHGVEVGGPPPHRHARNPLEYDFGRLAVTLPATGEIASLSDGRRLPDANDLPGEPEVHVPPFGCANWYPPPSKGRKFDLFGRLVAQTDDSGRRRTWTYDANDSVETFRDFDGSAHTQKRYSWNKLATRIDPVGGQTHFRWTTRETLAAVKDPGGCVIEYAWDQLGRLAGVRQNGVVRETYVYDAADNLIEKHSADGDLLIRYMPTVDRLIARKEFTSGTVQSFTYDDKARTLTAESDGVVASFAYDRLGNRTRDQRAGRGVIHAFRGYGNPTRTTALDAYTTSYERSNGQLVIRPPCGPPIAIQRLTGRVFRKTCGSAVTEISRYNAMGYCTLKAISFRQEQTTRQWTRDFSYSGEGDLLRVQDSRTGATHYSYDAAHRLISRKKGHEPTVRFEHDVAGNLLLQPGLTSVTMSAGNRISQANGTALLYDGRDRVTQRDDARYEYDSQDMLIASHLAAGTWRAEYDGLGRRTKVCWQGRERLFYWDTDRLAAEVDADGCTRVYVYSDPLSLTPVAFAEYAADGDKPADGRLFLVFSDQRGAPVLVTDECGKSVWRADLEAYGAATIDPSSLITLNFRFPGHYYDHATGLHYNRFRYYDPRIGRYLQPDPLGISGGINLYAYCTNPLSRVDVRGLVGDFCPCPTCGGGPQHEDCPLLPGASPPEEPTQEFVVILSDDVLNHGDRDMIVVATSEGPQGFYRSSGANSGMPGAWLPFDEVLPETMGGWINKWRFTDPQHGGVAEGDPSGLHRFGTEENRDISNTLGTMTIPPGRPATPSEVNDWLDSNGVPTTPTTLYRRGPPDDDLPPTQR